MKHVNEKQTLRHCMVVYAAYPRFETRVQREAEALVARGIQVDVICPRFGDEKRVDEHCGVRIFRVRQEWARRKSVSGQFGQYITFFIQASLKLASLSLRHRYDVIQVHNLPDFLVFCTLFPKLLGSRVILDLHDLMPEFYQGRFGQDGKGLLQRLVYLQERLSCRFADHVITVTEHWRQVLIRRGVRPEKCSVLMNLADPRVFHQLTPEERQAAHKPGFCLIYHGDMPDRYGLDLLLIAVNKLRDQIPGLQCRLIGGGRFLPTLLRMQEELNLNQGLVEFVDGVPVEQLPPLLAAADVAVVPYRNDVFTDSLLPTKLMEYAAMGLPCIVGRTTVIASYFDDSMVQFFKPGDVDDLVRSIWLLYEDQARRAQFAAGILKFHERHNWAQLGAQYEALVRGLARHGKRGAQEQAQPVG